ncbi:MAG: hypothetical protein V7K71_09170 [Nostoc sp.]
MTHKYQIRKLCTILLFWTRQRLKSVGVGRKSGDRTSCSLYQLDLQQ